MSRLRFSHVALNCRDPRRAEEFYTRHFGFRRARSIPLGDSEIVFLKSGDVYLELFAIGDGAGGGTEERGRADDAGQGDGPQTRGVRHLAFQVDSVDERLGAMGEDARVTLGPLDFDDFIPGWRTAWVSDPEGNIVEISQGFRDEIKVGRTERVG